MIVLDEQLLGRNLEDRIARWYRGAICFITDLRPNTIIKDDAIPSLLRQENDPTFVTINERDFWGKVAPDSRYCVVCFTLPDSRANEIPDRLRELLQHDKFDTKAKRMGRVTRITDQGCSYYSTIHRSIKSFDL